MSFKIKWRWIAIALLTSGLVVAAFRHGRWARPDGWLLQYLRGELAADEVARCAEPTSARCRRSIAKLKGSVGEGPNQPNYSDRSSVRILSKMIQEFSVENSKNSENFRKFQHFLKY